MRSYTVYITLVMLCLIISSLGQAAKPGRHDRGTIFSFHFDEGNGKVTKDFSGNENHAKLGGNKEPKWVKGPELHVGTALAFSNANFIEIPESQKLDTDDEITFEAWVNLDGLNSNWSTLYSKQTWSRWWCRLSLDLYLQRQWKIGVPVCYRCQVYYSYR